MIKQLLIFSTILLFSIGVSAQEKLMPLPFNNSYPSNSLEKGFQFDYDFVCNPEQRVSLQVTAFTKPDCGAQDGNGSVTLRVINGPVNSAYNFTYQTVNNETVTQSSNSNTFTFSNLSAGPYIFTVTGVEIADKLELWYPLDNVNTQPIPAIQGNFVKRDVFCDNLGSIGFSFDITDRALPIFRWFDGARMGTLSSQNLRVDLPPTLYYFRDTTSKSECHAYRIFEIGREATIDTLPFVEDFSTSLLYPDLAAWEDDFVFVNQTMAYQPLSIGVATFDGFNQFGQPYAPIPIEEGVGLIDGTADVLTSRPVCYNRMDEYGMVTSVFGTNDNEVFLRFQYQPQGLGDYPNSRDSLRLEFLGDDDNWYQVWKLKGPAKNEPFYPFKPVSVDVKNLGDRTALRVETHLAVRDDESQPYRDSSYVKLDTIAGVNFIFDGFQFRFSNKATISGFNDHWNIDYIEFDTKALGTIDDLTPIGSIPSLLNDYQAMPWTHFTNNVESSLKENLFIPLRNNSTVNEIGKTGKFTVLDVCTIDTLYSVENPTVVLSSRIILEPIDAGGTTARLFTSIDTDISDKLNTALDRDSVVFEVIYQLIDDKDQNQDNNLLYGYQKFFNYYAYDDGTAEVAYGLEGSESQLAMAFNVLEDDVLQAIQINFVNMNSNDEKNSLSLMVWDSIGVGSNKSNLIYSEEIDLSPQYVSQRNGFYTYVLENPLPVSAGTIYIGYEQDLKTQLNLGFDRNHDASSHTFFNSTSIWTPSILNGSVMMRPVFGKPFNEQDVNVGIEEENVLTEKVVLYPNPSNDRIYFQVKGNQSIQWVHIFDFSGRVIAEEYLENGGVDIRDLPNGLYLVKTYDADLQEMSMHKLLKQ
ncbi:MAG: T9SS type A sorting domain-containing protein [Chitinophagales bacterium]